MRALNKNICILVVEDNFALRFTLAEWLRTQHYTVCEAVNADEAKIILASPITIDLVITDVEMPGTINGIGLVEHIQEAIPHLEVVVVSGNDAAYQKLRDQEIVFFKKPYDLHQISRHIEKTIKDRKPAE